MANKMEAAAVFMVNIANDASHGYDQVYRWGEKGDYDCSSLLITATERAGIPVKTKGATYTGNMYNVFTKCGFKDVTRSVNLATGAGLQRCDVLLHKTRHTALYLGNGQIVQASINEKGTAKYGKPGDQKQLWGQKGEINITSYRNYPWQCVLRYEGSDTATIPTSKFILTVDGWFGYNSVLRTQQFFGTTMDGFISEQPKSNKKYWYCTTKDSAFEWVSDRSADGSDVAVVWQNWLRKKGYYKGKIDGFLGPKFVTALQEFLRDAGYYTGAIDGSAGNATCKAWQSYLNNH